MPTRPDMPHLNAGLPLWTARAGTSLRERGAPARLIEVLAAMRHDAGYPGGNVECFRMDPAVMRSQDLTDVAWPVGEGAVADLAVGNRQMGNVTGKRWEHDVAHRFS